MLTNHDWRCALQAATENLLRQAGHSDPPVDAVGVARALELTVALDRAQSGRGRITRIAGRPAIFLRPEERPERLQWAAAHELGESQIETMCRSLGLSGGDLSSRQREELANQFAKELLLPAAWFPRDCQVCDYDLPKLKAKYRTASHELIALRWLDLETPGIVTVFDHGVASVRRSNGPTCPPLTAAEQSCWGRLRNVRQPVRRHAPPLTLRGWCVDSPGWQREILYATWSDESC